MTKQNFLAMSLDSGLKILREFDNKIYTLFGMSGKHTVEAIINENNIELCAILAYGDCQIDDDEKFKIILRPISDLTKEIEHGGEKFVPMKRLVPESFGHIKNVEISDFLDRGVAIISNLDTDEQLHIYTDNGISISTRNHRFNVSDFRIINLLIKWHFDIADLLSKNEAIDINTIENPYK